MEAIVDNPFRILGLPITATERQIAKRVSDLEIYTDLGKPIKYETDFNFIPEVKRTPESIREAYSRIERPDSKVLYSFFWFYKKSNVDELCFDLLAKGNAKKAIELWEKNQKESNKDIDVFSSKRNLMVMYLLKSYNETLSSFEKALLNTKGILSDDKSLHKYIEEVRRDKRAAEVETIKRNILEEIHEDFKGFVGENRSVALKEFLNLFKKLPKKYGDFIINKYVNDPIRRIEQEIQKASDSIKKDPLKADKVAEKLYKVTRNELSFLQKVLTKKDIQYQTIADKLASTLLQCSIAYYNKRSADKRCSDPTEDALKLAKRAEKIAEGKVIKDKIKNNIDILRKNQETNQKYSDVEEPLEIIKSSLDRVEIRRRSGKNYYRAVLANELIDKCRPELQKIKKAHGAGDDLYKQFSDVVAAVALGLCIEYANRTQNYKKVLPIVRKIGRLDMSSELRTHYSTNRNILERNLSAQGGGGCYIATMVYKDKMAPEVLTFKKFRDRVLRKSFPGRIFIKLYYFFSPGFVKLFKNNKKINTNIRKLLDRLLLFLGDDNG